MWVKVCGITCTEDAVLAVAAGADAIGLNFVPSSKRHISLDTARAVVEAVSGRARVIGVVADLDESALRELLAQSGVDTLQLHGHEPAHLVERLLPDAFKVIHVENGADVDRARSYPGDLLLLDTKSGDQLGGTGKSFDWSLVRGLAAERRVVVAGGLTVENVAQAIEQINPWGVDVASGTEASDDPRRKRPELVARFIERARNAAKR
ncbi:MAG TPA: phosphoribosylanthranilate isomerase [Polyangiaceae bacterium]|nr:phosphoribosylanthranilate isomerase [Polyangiaceae bacterium]